VKRIVVVEDEVRIRVGLVNLINKLAMGSEVIGDAGNGYEGLKLICDVEPDFIITDIQMPKMNGLEMIEELQKLGYQGKFIILSGYAEFEYAQQSIHLGVKEYLLKPVSVTAVKELLKSIGAGEQKKDVQEEDNDYSYIVNEMISDMKKNYGLRIGPNSYSKKFHMTPEYLSNLFAKETGVTFSTYLKELRMEKAISLLLEREKKIYEIAYLVGYPDPKYFSKVFKEYTGVSAKQFLLGSKKDEKLH